MSSAFMFDGQKALSYAGMEPKPENRKSAPARRSGKVCAVRRMSEADMEFDRLLDYIRQNVFDKRHGIDRENALVKAQPRHITKAR